MYKEIFPTALTLPRKSESAGGVLFCFFVGWGGGGGLVQCCSKFLRYLWVVCQGVQHLSRVQFTDFTDNLLTNHGQIYWHTVPQIRITGAKKSTFCPILRELEEARRRRKFLDILYLDVPEEQKSLRYNIPFFPDIFLTFHQKGHFYWHFPDIFPPSGHFTDIYWFYWLYWRAGHPVCKCGCEPDRERVR